MKYITFLFLFNLASIICFAQGVTHSRIINSPTVFIAASQSVGLSNTAYNTGVVGSTVLRTIDAVSGSSSLTGVNKIVSTTAVRMTVSGSAPSTTRKLLMISQKPSDTTNCSLGGASGAGVWIPRQSAIIIENDSSDFYAVCDGSSNIAVTELVY